MYVKAKLGNLKWWHWLLIVILGLTVLGSLFPSSQTDDIEASNPTDSSSVSERDTDSKESSSACIRLPQSVIEAIASGQEEGVGMVPVIGYAIKSPDFNNVYFMAIEFEATGVKNQVGVFARNGLETGLILSVDGFAKEFTVWPDASKTDAQISGADRSIDVVKNCI